MRDESAEPHDDPVILRNRAEAFADGYRQCFADFLAWSNGQPGVPVDYITDNMEENANRYTDFADSYDRIREGIAEAEAGLTVDRGDFTQYLDEPQGHVYLSTSCLHGDLVLSDGRTGHEYCHSEANPVGPKIPAQCKFCQAPCVCDCHKEPS